MGNYLIPGSFGKLYLIFFFSVSVISLYQDKTVFIFFVTGECNGSIWFLSTESNMETTEELHEIFSFSVILTQLPKSMLYHLFFEFSFLLGSSIKCSMELWQINFNCPPKNNTKMVLELSCTFPLFTKFYKANFFRTFVYKIMTLLFILKFCVKSKLKNILRLRKYYRYYPSIPSTLE